MCMQEKAHIGHQKIIQDFGHHGSELWSLGWHHHWQHLWLHCLGVLVGSSTEVLVAGTNKRIRQ